LVLSNPQKEKTMRSALTALTVFVLISFACTTCSAAGDSHTYSGLAQRLLEHVKYGEPHTVELDALRTADPSALCVEIQTDSSKKAFWINLYNACAQLQIQKSAALYNDKTAFFKSKDFTVAGHRLSLDDIEHRMLRRAHPSMLPRFMRPLLMSGYLRRLSVSRLDPRIHFALNCNARSCPPILFYDAEKIDAQLEAATRNYLQSSVAYDSSSNVLALPELFSWFASDFGGRQGIVDLLRSYNIIGRHVEPTFTYKPWDWAPEPGRFH
jgi:hypothetical protein